MASCPAAAGPSVKAGTLAAYPTKMPDGGELVPGYDALLIVGFGGPERREDVMPFLENVTRGRNVPRERLLAVAEHYDHFGGKSPLNDQVRALIAALKPELARRRVELPIYWGNRNWHPFLADTMRQMTEAGVSGAVGLVLAAYNSYSSCRQYLEDIARLRPPSGRSTGRRQDSRVLQPSGLHRGQRRPSQGRAGRDAAPSPRIGPRGLHRPQHPRLDGRELPLRSAASRGVPPRLRTARHPGVAILRSSTKAAAAARATRGWAPTSSNTWPACRRRASATSSCCRLAFCPTTSKCSTTSTAKPATRAANSTSTWFERRQSARTRPSWRRSPIWWRSLCEARNPSRAADCCPAR